MHTTMLELENIQGYLIRGYAHMLYSRFVYMQISDAEAFKKWLSKSWQDMTSARHIHDKSKISPTHLNIAFTHDGLAKLGLHKENLDAFSREFRQGMVSPHRSRLLGDSDESNPENWNWGANHNEKIHLCLMVFGNDKSGRDDLEKDKIVCLDYYRQLESEFKQNGIEPIFYIDGQTQPDNKEHFGFRDGISQPIIEGSGRVGDKDDVVKAGEFLFGYKNEFGVYPDTPLIVKEQGNLNLLSPDAGGSGQKDIGKDGTFVVMRQLKQDVTKFWSFLNESSKNPDGSINVAESLKLGARFVGRWQNGAPITLFPDADPGTTSDVNDFGYSKFDKDGLKCPFGSHLRRTNPRDNVDDHGKKESLKLSKQHRIIRRARLYGEIYEGSPTNLTPTGEVGLIFICFNADISRQFEFLQYTWSNLPKNKELYNDPDPIIGVRANAEQGEEQNFTIQDLPVNRTIKNLPQVITVKGGAYFFFPSINVLRYLSTI
ncbi:Dyp-type peroxidase [uncultured Algoriphagus sp.]|uniref:Dyp-type peroxidase n=1 Tax=uncultured Algoriphagus sp. TaxID=417365 RepID=UPI0030ED5A68